MNTDTSAPAALGFRARTGRAIAVLLAGPADAPRAAMRAEVSLTSPDDPATSQPYHEVMELPWAEALAEARKTEAAVEAVAKDILERLVRDARAGRLEVRCIGVVGSPDRDLSAIGNPHIRAHAAEGILFRRVLESAAAKIGLPGSSYAEAGLEAKAASLLRLSPAALRAWLARFGRSVGRPWRADEKAAAIAAWLVLVENGRR